MKLFQYEKYDEVIWERCLNILMIGKYSLLNLSLYESDSAFGVKGNLSLVFPIQCHFACLWFRLGTYVFHVSVVNEL